MKRQVRRNVFETNSSSTHSISICNGSLDDNYMYVNENDNKIHIEFGEFGWEIDSYTEQNNKLSYLVTMLVETEGRGLSTPEELFETEGYKTINEEISNYCKCDGIHIDSKLESRSYRYKDNAEYYLDHDGYIDHQSTEDYESVKDFLEQNNTNVIDFVFNTSVVVNTDNDNY